MLKNMSYRLSLIFRSHFRKKGPDPLKEFEDYILRLEQQLNHVSVSLADFKAREAVLRSELKSEQIKIDKVRETQKTISDKNSMEYNQLSELENEYLDQQRKLKGKLMQAENSRTQTQKMHTELHAAIQKVMDQGEDLKARYYHAEARQSLYGDSSGITNKDGVSRMDHLLNKVKNMEAQADSFYELSPLELKLDTEI